MVKDLQKVESEKLTMFCKNSWPSVHNISVPHSKSGGLGMLPHGASCAGEGGQALIPGLLSLSGSKPVSSDHFMWTLECVYGGGKETVKEEQLFQK